MREYDADEDPIRAFVQHDPIPADAGRLGFDRNTEEGAMIAMAGSLSPAKLTHRVVAWAMLLVFAAPFLVGVLQKVF